MTAFPSKLCVAWLTALTGAVAFVALRDAPVAHGAPPAAPARHLTLDELDVRRINIVEPDGKPRVIISSKSRMPGVIFTGKDYPFPRDVGGGLLFFNDEGTEAGGLTYATRGTGADRDNYAVLTVDQYDQNEQVALTYGKSKGQRTAGLAVYADLPETSLLPAIQAYGELQAAKTAEDRQRAQARLKAVAGDGVGGAPTRVFVGKEGDDAKLVLSDKLGRPRIVLGVDGRGEPRVELLDATGKVTKRITER